MEDEREVELSAISAIFPEILLDENNPFSATLDLPVNPAKPLPVSFPAAADGNLATDPSALSNGTAVPPPSNAVSETETSELAYLPPLHLKITLPDGYPSSQPPIIDLTTSPAWLSGEILDQLRADGTRLWEEFGHDQVVFAYIDHLQQAAENAFGVLDEAKTLEVPEDYKISLLDYDINAKRAAFEKETFDCGICLDPKKGLACHRMLDCGHVFCVQCLQDFYNNAIEEGDLISVRCLTPNCDKERSEESQKKHKKAKMKISPSELLQIPLSQDMVKRYVMLKHKMDLEADKDTVYCPRRWCQGAARSKKHRKPEGLEIVEASDSEESEKEEEVVQTGEKQAKKKKNYVSGDDLLCICEDCAYAFCSRCLQGWHGSLQACTPPRSNEELTEEEKASMEYIKLHTSLCPTCAAPSQKTHGCNHMVCSRCNTHFCYLCSSWLEPGNPYKHFNTVETKCYMRLWELEGGDGDDVGYAYAGGNNMGHLAPGERPDEYHAFDDDVEDDEDDEPIEILREVDPAARAPHGVIDPAAAPPAAPVPPVQRIAPLVLQIFDNGRPAAPPAIVPPPEFGVQRGRGGRGGVRGGRGNVRGGGGVRGGGVRGRRAPHPFRDPRVQVRIVGRGNINMVGFRGNAEALPAMGRAREAPARPVRGNANGRGMGGRGGFARGRHARGGAAGDADIPGGGGGNGGGGGQMQVLEEDEEQRAWIQNFVQMALNDEEDLVEWDSDDEEDGRGAWEIPVR